VTIKKKQISANYRKINQAPVIPKTQGMTMGILITGGIGDYIQATRTVRGLIRKFQPTYTEIYTHPYTVGTPNTSTNAFGIFDNMVKVSQVTDIKNHETLHRTSIRLAPYYDIWADLRYISKLYLSEKAKKQLTARSIFPKNNCGSDYLGNHPARWWHYNFLANNNELGKLGKNLMELRDLSLGITTTPNNMTISINDAHIKQAQELTSNFDQFICIHHGAHPKCQTKLWKTSHWEELVEAINQEIKIPVVQIGTSIEDTIRGVINLLGQTTLQSAAIIAASASAYINIEGGIIHARRAITTDPAIVLFGATPITAFGYDENINISADVCEPCWWITPQWGTTCPREINYKCMRAITPKRVFDAVLTCCERSEQAQDAGCGSS